MPNKEELQKHVDDILGIAWDVRDGTTVPSTETVTLKNGAVKINAAFLYADLASTSQLARVCPWETTAKIIRAYLDTSVRIIKSYSGEIRSFDGDRVMGVFIGDAKNSRATKAAREIFYTVEYILGPKAIEKFNSIKNNNIKLKNCVGIDYGDARAVRAGIRNSNDLIWIGKAPSLAAKLSDIRNYANCVYISKASYDAINESAKYENNKNIWTAQKLPFAGISETVYSTNYTKTP
ncbi:class 3 adenylate cyclase [Sphingomonas vulcanisoli]|uniref:Class 3 adenylate cyclase n=1 Tax=Sphingomonas vulcanisoli TaxID=1658060 RepID=A0ABX0TN33_9SPHN|nr:adenylate/guanylate cyclase domain-containing protein [Sphingomonas vulcanisoli]NIJ06846.1 class 3 adenylate cyclase [Sphingomonas vulcanisoli]